ncbi:MAG: hypothetical protein GX493_05180 [Firmicutes bacterium]|nr:hypothetical protein [Bacillota bacterium]
MRIDPRLFLPPPAVAEAIAAVAQNRQPFALIRIGDGEALTLAQGTVRPWAYVAAKGFLRTAGVIVPDRAARERVAFAVRHADVVGVAARRDLPDFAPLTEEVFRYFGLAPRRICDCCINYALQESGLLVPLLAGRRLFLVNRRWRAWAAALRRLYGLEVIGGAGIDHCGQAEAVLAAAARHRFDFALLAAGVPATWRAVVLARRHRCVALDLGRLADLMIDLCAAQERPGLN